MGKSKIIISSILSVFIFMQPAMAKDTTVPTNSSTQQLARTVDLNEANAKEIADSLSGIGLKKAQRIVAYRNKHGDFQRIEDITKVKGIGTSTLNKNRGKIALN